MPYKIISENCALGEPGDTVKDSDLDGLNIEALVDGGHIAKTTNTKKEAE